MVGILKSCASSRLSVSRLLSSQNLSYRLLRSYLDRLLAGELIKLQNDGERKSFTTTDRGLAVLRCYGNGVALLNGHIADCPLVRCPAQQVWS